jgi:hypothetical protein
MEQLICFAHLKVIEIALHAKRNIGTIASTIYLTEKYNCLNESNPHWKLEVRKLTNIATKMKFIT